MIFMYHYLGTPPPGDRRQALYVPPHEFRMHLQQLAAMGRRTVSPEEYAAELEGGDAHQRSLAWLTFDDGQIDNYDPGLAILTEAGQRATFFIITDRSLTRNAAYVGPSQMREMLAAGMSIGSHTVSHPRLSQLTREQVRHELRTSKAQLEDCLGVEITSLCYPYGDYNAMVAEEAREAGYALAVTTCRGNRNTAHQRHELLRVIAKPGLTWWRFRYLGSPAYHLLHGLKGRRRGKA